MSKTLTEFLLARIAEDEDRAKRAAFGWGRAWTSETGNAEDWSVVHADGKRDMVGCEDGAVTEHIARHDPARALADCEAKWRIVERHRGLFEGDAGGVCNECGDLDVRHPCPTLRDLALSYIDHPDYREEWHP